MSEMISISKEEIARQEQRLSALARDKASAQLMINLMTSLTSVHGLEDAVEAMLQIVLAHVGGTKLAVFYRIDEEVFYADIFGEKRHLDAIEDPLVKQVFETREFLEHRHDFDDTQLTTSKFTDADTWVFPLLVGPDLIGVFKIEGMPALQLDLKAYLPTFFAHAALVLKNEILGHTRLQEAYAKLEQEMLVRKQVEQELREAKSNLENKVAERTEELRRVNRLYDVLSHVNQATVRATTREALLAEACNIAVEHGKFHLAWIGLVDWTTLKVNPVASAGPQRDYASDLRLSVQESSEGWGAVGAAVRDIAVRVINDLAADSRVAAWRDGALQAGFQALAAVPIRCCGRVDGVLAIYSAEKNVFYEKEIALLEEIAAAVSAGLDRIKAESEGEQAEEALRQSEEKYHQVFENSPVSKWVEDFSGVKALLDTLKKNGVTDIETYFTQHPEDVRRCAELTKIVDVNRAALALHGAGKKEELLADLANLFTQESFNTFRQELVCLWNGQTEMTRDAVVETLAGDRRNVTIHFSVCPGHEETLSKVLVSLTDITDRTRAEKALLASEQKYRLLVANAGEAIFVVQDGVIKFPNPRTLELTGYSAEELAKTPFEQLVHPDERTMVVEGHLQEQMQKRLPEVPRFRIVDKQGRQIWTQLTTAQINWEERAGMLCFLRDISEEKKLEAQFLQAQKMEALGQLAGGVAHDFNNLLQVILGYADILLGSPACDAGCVEALGEVRQAANRASDLTRQLLAFSRRQIIQPVNVDLNDLVHGVLKMIRRVIGENIALCFMPGDRLGTVHVDKGQMEQVLMNLCVNARDAMPTGGALTIETQNVVMGDNYCREHPWATAGRYVLLSVTDTGQGMDEATRAQIFDPFFTTKGVGQGTGLGLATVYGIVRQHNALINVYSELEKGTAFKIYIPVAEQRAEEVESKIEERTVGGNETILVAEDEAAVRNLVRYTLESAGYTVLTACDGEDALRVFEDHADAIRLALLDVMMPKLSGGAVMEQIQARHPGMRFLFSSGYSQSAIHTSFVLRDGLRLITKPYCRADLLHAVREILDAP